MNTIGIGLAGNDTYVKGLLLTAKERNSFKVFTT